MKRFSIKIPVFLFILVMFYALSVYANTYCPQESCSNTFFLGSYVGVGSASFTPAYVTSSAYTSCTTDNSLFDPVAADLDNDGINEYIVIPSTTTVDVYKHGCSLMFKINETNITSPASLIDYNFDNKTEIAITTSSSLDIFYGNGTLLTSFNYRNFTNGSLVNVGCDDFYCFGQNETSNSSAIIRLKCDYNLCYLSPNITVYSKNLKNNNVIGNPKSQGTTVFTDTINKKSRAGSWCYPDPVLANTLDCDRLDSDGTVTRHTLAGASFNIQSIQYVQSFFAKSGSVIRYYLTAFFTKATVGQEASMIVTDDSNNVLTNSSSICGSAECGRVSGWMVGQFDKTNHAYSCLFFQNITLCYQDGYFGSPTYNYTISPFPVNYTGIPFMADFNVSVPFMGFASAEGIFYALPNGTSYSIFRTGYNSFYAPSNPSQRPLISFLNSPVTSVTPVFHFIGLPDVLYSDSQKSTNMIQGFNGLCGNGVCDPGELFSCPSDCSAIAVTYPTVCSFDAQCSPAFPKCIASKCVSGFSGVTCNSNQDCPFNASICFNNFCVSGVSGGYNYNVTGNLSVAPTAANFGQLIDNWFATLFMGSTVLRLIAGLILMLLIFLKINSKFNVDNKSNVLMLIIFGVVLVLFTLLGIVNFWVIMSVVAICFTLLITYFVLKFKPSEG